MPAVFGMRPAATRIWLPSIVCSPELVRSVTLTALPDWPLDLDEFGGNMDLNALAGQDPPDFLRGVGVLSAHQLRPGFDDGHFGAEAAIGLRQFEAGIAAADHDQMRGHDVELERFDMGQRLRGLEAGNVGNGGARSHIDEDLAPRQRTRPAVIQVHFERFRRDEAARRP